VSSHGLFPLIIDNQSQQSERSTY